MKLTPIALAYSRAAQSRWRRLFRFTIVALLLVALAFAGLFAFRNLALWLARREGRRVVAAWYERARTCVIPAGTLVYSENPADFATARFGHVSPGELAVDPCKRTAARDGPALVIVGERDAQTSPDKDARALDAALATRPVGRHALVITAGASHDLKRVTTSPSDAGLVGDVLPDVVATLDRWTRDVGFAPKITPNNGD